MPAKIAVTLDEILGQLERLVELARGDDSPATNTADLHDEAKAGTDDTCDAKPDAEPVPKVTMADAKAILGEAGFNVPWVATTPARTVILSVTEILFGQMVANERRLEKLTDEPPPIMPGLPPGLEARVKAEWPVLTWCYHSNDTYSVRFGAFDVVLVGSVSWGHLIEWFEANAPELPEVEADEHVETWECSKCGPSCTVQIRFCITDDSTPATETRFHDRGCPAREEVSPLWRRVGELKT